MHAAFAFGETDAAVIDPVGLIVGASGTPIPGAIPGYIPGTEVLYLTNPLNFDPKAPADVALRYTGTPSPALFPNGVNTPQGLYPLTGVKTLPLNYPTGADGYTPGLQTSVAQGETILNQDILQAVQDGGHASVFGYSQSATIASYEMAQLASSPATAVGLAASRVHRAAP
jgi:PE-PPE domain